MSSHNPRPDGGETRAADPVLIAWAHRYEADTPLGVLARDVLRVRKALSDLAFAVRRDYIPTPSRGKGTLRALIEADKALDPDGQVEP